MPDLDFTGLEQAARSAFKPHYADVVHRAGRRRRHARAAGAAAVVVAVAAAGGTASTLLGHAGGGAASPGPNGATAPGDMPVPSHAPSPGSVPSPVVSWAGPGPAPTGEAPVERQAVMYAGDLDHLYSLLMGCAGCPARLAASEDGGATWRWHDLPVDGPMAIDVVAPRTLVMGADPELNNNPATMKWRTSTDGGATWQERSLRKVASVPAGWVATYLGDGVFAADPATGDFAMVTSSPVKIRPLMQNGLPASAGIWDSGYAKEGGDEVSMIANSRDGGATWRTYTFPDRVVAGFDNQEWGSLAIATADGQTVYAVGKLSGQLHVYRSTDGGGSWQRTAARAETGVGFPRGCRAGRRHARDPPDRRRRRPAAAQHRPGRVGVAGGPRPGRARAGHARRRLREHRRRRTLALHRRQRLAAGGAAEGIASDIGDLDGDAGEGLVPRQLLVEGALRGSREGGDQLELERRSSRRPPFGTGRGAPATHGVRRPAAVRRGPSD